MKEGTEVKMWCAYTIIRKRKYYDFTTLRWKREDCRKAVRYDLEVEKVTVTIKQS